MAKFYHYFIGKEPDTKVFLTGNDLRQDIGHAVLSSGAKPVMRNDSREITSNLNTGIEINNKGIVLYELSGGAIYFMCWDQRYPSGDGYSINGTVAVLGLNPESETFKSLDKDLVDLTNKYHRQIIDLGPQ
jgi:hypothetical protein